MRLKRELICSNSLLIFYKCGGVGTDADGGQGPTMSENVKIPDSQRLGKVNDGWNVSLTTLMNERMSTGARTGPVIWYMG